LIKYLQLVLILLILVRCSDETDDALSNIRDNGEEKQMKDSTKHDSGEDVDTINTDNIAYLALGDSYTIGESVLVSEQWPVLLVDRARQQGFHMDDPMIIAKTGWTTGELLAGIEAAGIGDNTYDFVSLLIGVNNQYRGMPIGVYKSELKTLIEKAIFHANGNTTRVFLVSIPDYGVTPFASSSNTEEIAKEIDSYNAIKKDYADSLGIKFFNITPISRTARENPSFIASDGLHPSGIMYQMWVNEIDDWFISTLNER